MPDDRGPEPDDPTAWARRRSAEIAARIARVAEGIADTEDAVARAYEGGAALRPHAAERLTDRAAEARRFAEHEREQARLLRGEAGEEG